MKTTNNIYSNYKMTHIFRIDEMISDNRNNSRTIPQQDDDALLREIDDIQEYVYSLDENDAYEYILKNRQTGLEIELSCGIHFGMGLYAYKDQAEEYLPKSMIYPMKLNNLFVSLEKPNVLRTYIKNSFIKNGGLIE